MTIEELQEILNEEHQETQRNVSPSEQEEDERGPMPTSAIKDLLKTWEAVRAMVLEEHPNQAEVSRTENHNFEVVSNFACLGSNMGILNDIGAEIKRRIIAANRSLRGLRVCLKKQMPLNPSRLRLAGHICRMDPPSLAYRISNYKLIGTRTRGRSNLRWADSVEDDLKILRVTNWRTVAKRRSEWNRVLEKALVHPVLLCQ
ncbi:uncharacterized protein TNCV_487601 [Trichonephila clavipes]|nr:uncharacterized protein TNCV_487601 [Trichonephila clavipes]